MPRQCTLPNSTTPRETSPTIKTVIKLPFYLIDKLLTRFLTFWLRVPVASRRMGATGFCSELPGLATIRIVSSRLNSTFLNACDVEVISIVLQRLRNFVAKHDHDMQFCIMGKNSYISNQ